MLEEKADAITQTIENVTVATFSDGADEGMIKKLLVSIEPIQEGEGDPSPENVRPISGRDGVKVTRTGINAWDEQWENGTFNTTPSTGAQVVYNLAEPVEYQLTPQEVTTLLGTNNIWADSGNILELEYTADTKLYIGEQQSASSGTLGMVNRPTVVDKQIEPVAEITDTDSEVTE